MVDVTNLNRIKGILSAKQGAEIPKFQQGAKFAMYNGRQMIYSSDQSSWFNDESLTSAYTGSLGGFKSVQYDPKTPKNPLKPSPHLQTAIPGDPKITPTTAVETAADTQEKVRLTQQEYEVGKRYETLQISQEAKAQATAALNKPPTLDTNLLQQDINKGISETSAGFNLEKAEKAQAKIKGANIGNAIGQGVSVAMNAVGQAVASKQQATDSNLTKTADSVYGGVAEAAKNMGPVGQLVGTAMQNAKIAGDIIQELGGGTDQQTKMDKWMDSAFFSWNIGMLNGFAGKNTQDFGVDQNIVAQVGSSYGGTVDSALDAAEKAGKKYGLFSTKARKKADAAINKARSQQNLMGNIADNAADQRLAVQSMGEQAGLAYSMMTSGGYDQKYTYAAKHGGLLNWTPVIELDWEPTVEWEPQIELNWELPTFKEGGNIDINEELEWIPEFKKGGKSKLSKTVLDFYKDYDLSGVNIEMSDSPRTEGNTIYISNDEDAIHELWHYLSNNQPNEDYKDYYDSLNDDRIIELGGDLQFVKRFENDPGHFYHPSELEARIKAAKFKTQGQAYTTEFFQNLRKDENKYGNNMRDLLHMYNDDNLVKIFSLKRGGSLGDSDIPEIEETTQKNVIPEGALHKNKHHMEHAEGLTKKGIPVIDDDGDQQAEIEHSEIIFTLEVTKKLEEYYEIFYSDESSNKEKEQAALEAGKLLVYQILENTEDRTGLIDSCKKGGTLTLKKTADDLIEEALEDVSAVVIVEEEIINTPKKKEEKSDKELMKEAIKEVLIELLTK